MKLKNETISLQVIYTTRSSGHFHDFNTESYHLIHTQLGIY